MSFSQALDRYLTTPPESNDEYYGLIYECYSDDFYNNLELFENSELENKWINKLEMKGVSPEVGAKIIERAYQLYFNKINTI